MKTKTTSIAVALALAFSSVAFAADPMADGAIKKAAVDAGKITIKHGPIPNLQMDPMTMVFKASTDDLSCAVGHYVTLVVGSTNG